MITPAEALDRYKDLYNVEPNSILRSDFPDIVSRHIADRGQRGLHQHEEPVLVESQVVRHSNRITYIDHLLKSHQDGLNEEEIHAVDCDATGSIVGYGYVRTIHNHTFPELSDIPFVGYTYTESAAQGERLGLRRLFILNAATRLLLGSTLHSGHQPTQQAGAHWQTLEAAGFARAKSFGSHDRYRFVA